MWQTVLYAAGLAGTIAISGYLKASSPETFSWKKFTRTLVLAMIFSIGSSLTGLTPDAFSSSVIGVFLDQLVENILKAIFKEESKLKKLLFSE